MEVTRVKLTKKSIAALKPPATGQAFIWDSEVKGFGVRVTAAGTKSWIVQYPVPGKKSKPRKTIGAVSEMDIEEARNKAIDIKLGRDPVAVAAAPGLPLLMDVWEKYKESRVNLKARTIKDYQKILDLYIPDFAVMPLNAITSEMVQRRHLKIGATNKVWANYTSRVIRALFNLAEAAYPECTNIPNPVRILTKTKGWYRIQRRQTRVKNHEMGDMYHAITRAVTSDTVRDYLLLIFFTGNRPGMAAAIRWDHVDLRERSLHFPDPKNGVSVTLPVGRRLAHMLEMRRMGNLGSPWVFPGGTATGHIGTPQKQILHVRASSRTHFTITHLRRTFATIAREIKIPDDVLKKFMTHKSAAVAIDVTDGYVVDEVERLRPYIQQIEDFLMELVENSPPPLKRGEERVRFFDSESGAFSDILVPVADLLR